jgi:hypothetical protein
VAGAGSNAGAADAKGPGGLMPKVTVEAVELERRIAERAGKRMLEAAE